MVITAEIARYGVSKVLVDQGSSVNILYWKTFQQMDISEDLIVPYNGQIVGFAGERVDTRDFHAPDPDQDDPMVITAEIARYGVSKVLVDQGSSVNILYWKTFQQMDISEDLIVPYNGQIVGFAGERVDTRGYVELRTRLGTGRSSEEKRVRYLLVEANTSYNVLLGRPCLNAFGAIVSTPHLTMKYPSEKGTICTVRADKKTARECYAAADGYLGGSHRPLQRPNYFHAPDPDQDDPMVITAEIARYGVSKVLVDQGSSVNILYWKTFQQMDISEDLIVPYNGQIVGFAGERVDTRDFHAPDPDQDDPMVITAEIARYGVSKVLVDQGSSVNILYWKTFQQMDISEDLIVPYNGQIVGFAGERVDTRDFHAPDPDQDDPMVITAEIARYGVSKVLVDQGSSVNILYWKTFQQMDISEDLIVPYNGQIVGFAGERVDTRDFHAPDPDQDDPMVITAEIARYGVSKVLVDQGSSVNILYWKTFQQMDISEDLIVPYNGQIVGFAGERVDTRDFHAPDPDQDDPMVITAEIARYGVSKVLVDQGSSVNILYWKTFQQMDISEDLIVPYNGQIVGFAGERVDTRDFHAPDPDQDDPMVITAEIARYGVSKVLVDQGSSVNILYWKTFQQMDISEDLIVPYNGQIVGFAGERVDTRDFHAPDPDQDDPMVITAEIARYGVSKVLVDQGSSVNILYWKTFQQMDISEDLIVPYNGQIAPAHYASHHVLGLRLPRTRSRPGRPNGDNGRDRPLRRQQGLGRSGELSEYPLLENFPADGYLGGSHRPLQRPNCRLRGREG
ncbi:hypothetical protein LR48_Vigan03g100700 [Vigna angularis]|uniref:Peptidase A2 domain-containing protein n=1 Tax=Phaseolus angularis TaxID=3914 RepID=A0A0L9U4B3_PHAAN|nr:hypothetical protein LR48_Vigan03g100700 [Vigna angularis]